MDRRDVLKGAGAAAMLPLLMSGMAKAEDVDVVVAGVGEVAVGRAAGVDGLEDGEGLGVEHGDGLAGGEAVVELGVDDGAVCGAGGDFADGREGVEVIDVERAGGARAGDVEAARIGVGLNVVEAAIAADDLSLEDLVLGVGEGGGEYESGESER